MKKGRFLWSAHRITKKQKAGKARNIKEKQLKNSRNTVSKQLVALRSSANDNSTEYQKRTIFPENIEFSGISLYSDNYAASVCDWCSRCRRLSLYQDEGCKACIQKKSAGPGCGLQQRDSLCRASGTRRKSTLPLFQ